MKYTTPLLSLLIIIAVTLPGRKLPDVHIGGYDKLVHMAMFFLWALAVHFDFNIEKRAHILFFLGAGVLFSVLTELLQIMVEGRSFDVYDMLADFVGLATGLLIGKPLIREIRKIRKR